MRTRNKDKAIKIGLIIVLIALAVGVAGNYIRSHNIKIITIPAETAYVTYEGYGFVCVNEYLMSANMSGACDQRGRARRQKLCRLCSPRR